MNLQGVSAASARRRFSRLYACCLLLPVGGACGCSAEPTRWQDALGEARRIEAQVLANDAGAVDLAAVLGDRPSRLLSKGAHIDWIEFLGLWGARPLLVIAANSLRHASQYAVDSERARFMTELMQHLERRLSGDPLPAGFASSAATFLQREENQNHETMSVANWAYQLAITESLSEAATPEQIGYARGCVERTAQLEFVNSPPEEIKAFGNDLWSALCWDNLEESRLKIIAAVLRTPTDGECP